MSSSDICFVANIPLSWLCSSRAALQVVSLLPLETALAFPAGKLTMSEWTWKASAAPDLKTTFIADNDT